MVDLGKYRIGVFKFGRFFFFVAWFFEIIFPLESSGRKSREVLSVCISGGVN